LRAVRELASHEYRGGVTTALDLMRVRVQARRLNSTQLNSTQLNLVELS